MTTKDQIIQELDQIPESMLDDVLEFVRSLKEKYHAQQEQSDVWKAYLTSLQEREEVYRRLANS